MKRKRIVIAVAALLALSLVGCGSSAADIAVNSDPDPAPTAIAEVTTAPSQTPTPGPTSAPSATPTVEPTVEPTVDPTTEPTVEPAAETTPVPSAEPSAEPNPLPQVDYSGSVTDWMYTPETEDELVDLLIAIDSTPHGAAGSSLQQANSAVCAMKLAMEDSDKVTDAVNTYLSEMNDTQRDFFSFQWQQAVKLANGFLDGSEDAAILSDSGNSDFDLNAVDGTNLTDLDETVTDLLRSDGVVDDWKDQTDVDFFSNN